MKRFPIKYQCSWTAHSGFHYTQGLPCEIMLCISDEVAISQGKYDGHLIVI